MSYASRANESKIYFDNIDGREFLVAEDAVIFWTNFAGNPTTYNPQGGKRTFNLALSEEVADELRNRGWNVKERQPRDEDDDVLYFTEIILNFDTRWPPEVFLCTEKNGRMIKRRLNDETVGELDRTRAKCVDVIINPHKYNGNQFKYKGYATTVMFTKAESQRFGGKYDDYEDDSGDEDDDALPF